MSHIFHITRRADWEAAVETGDYRVSTLGKTLEEVGFIHCSTAQQVQRVADAHYRGVAELLLITLETDRISSPERMDAVGTEHYPHIYGPLNLDAAVQVTPLVTTTSGRIAVPDLPDL